MMYTFYQFLTSAVLFILCSVVVMLVFWLWIQFLKYINEEEHVNQEPLDDYELKKIQKYL